MIPVSEFDSLILSFCIHQWRKVARIAGHTYAALENQGIEISGATADAFDARMAVLVNSGQLEAQGNIKNWCFSEVRLPGDHVDAVKGNNRHGQ